MEGSTVAVFQVRKINNVSFGNKREKYNNNRGSVFLSYALLPSIILTIVFFPQSKFDIPGCASQQVSATAGSASSEVVGDSF